MYIACIFRDDPDLLGIYENITRDSENNNPSEREEGNFDFIGVV
jgi:hypothetical protein